MLVTIEWVNKFGQTTSVRRGDWSVIPHVGDTFRVESTKKPIGWMELRVWKVIWIDPYGPRVLIQLR